MGFIVTYDIGCDYQDKGKKCLYWTHGAVGGTGNATATKREARNQAVKVGWVFDGQRDLCPNCAKELGYESQNYHWRSE